MKHLLLLALGLLASPSTTVQDPPVEAAAHRVATFNIRYGSANDGADRWELRREKVMAALRGLDADVVGLQEAEAFQVREILTALPRYAAVSVHRDDGLLAGEATAVLYDRERYALSATDTFWLSDTPEVVASNTWGAACTRICTRVRLVDLGAGRAFTVYNAHFDHVSAAARDKSAALITQRAGARAEPFLVIGDLNAVETDQALRTLRRGGEDWDLVDAYRLHNPDASQGTFTGFDPASDGGTARIDHVLAGPGVRVTAAGIDDRKVDGRYPSDHFPVWADVEITGR